MTRVFHCSTLFGAATLAAAIDDGRFGEHDERRLLIVSNDVIEAEAYPSATELSGFAAIADRFDDVVSWNELIAPLHPAAWSPPEAEVPMLSRLVRGRLGLGAGDADVTELVLESVAVLPGRALADLVRDCPISVYAPGLGSYGPSPGALPPQTAERIGRLLHLDLAPGVRLLLLSEWDVPVVGVPLAALRRVVGAMTASPQLAPATGRRALILGQDLTALGVLEASEEADLHARALEAVTAAGYADVVFKPHPGAGRRHSTELAAVAAAHGVQLTVLDDAGPAEAYFAAAAPDLVVGCYSTALATASLVYGLPVATTGTELVLERLAPYENADRMAVTIMDATAPRLQPDGSVRDAPPVDLQRLVDAVGYCMQPAHYPQLRQAAVDHLAEHGRARYFKKRRLEALELIEKPPPKQAAPAPASLAGTLRAVAKDRIRRRPRG